MDMNISIKNREQLAEAIKIAEGRASVRRINVDKIIAVLAEVDERLSLVSTKKDAVGTIAYIDVHAQRFPSAYKYIPESTQFVAKLKRDGWRIIRITRERVNGPKGRIFIRFTAATIEHMADRVSVI